MAFVTVAEIRYTSGDSNENVSDATITAIELEVEAEAQRIFNTAFEPTPRIDVLDGTGTDRILLDKNPLLSVRSLTTNSTTVTPSYLHLYKEEGKILLGSSAEAGTFVTDAKSVIVNYLYGLVEKDSTNTTLSTATTAGTSVAMTVASETGFTANDWVVIYGTDGFEEVAKISATDTGKLTVDQLVLTHAASSLIYLLKCPARIKRFIEVESAIRVVTSILGITSTDIVGYDLGDLRVQKGEAYAQWQRSLQQLLKEKEEILKQVKPRFYATV